MKIYTKTGDKGETSIIGGRVKKSSLRIQAIGVIDEVNALIGEAIFRLGENHANEKELFLMLQHQLFDYGSDLANPKKSGKIDCNSVSFLELTIDKYSENLPELKQFILPGGSGVSASLHTTRTVVRRAERLIVELNDEESVDPQLIKYINRMSDLFFVLARHFNHILKVSDVFYVTKK